MWARHPKIAGKLINGPKEKKAENDSRQPDPVGLDNDIYSSL